MDDFFRKNKIVIILASIILFGLFVRSFNHHDFLRFNPDQSRDAALVRDVVNGKESWPLLGPKAGGTDFRLGGAFYQIEIIAGKIFGSEPDRLAFPDLFFSVASLVLLYFFLREFFSEKISLTVTGLASISFYAVKYARFAWNPNSLPFYVLFFLYAIYRLSKNGEKRPWLWALLTGLAAGIGVQLHSLILFTFPFVFVAYFAYLFFKKNPVWKWAPLILLIGLILNSTQIVSEFETGGKNMQAFFQGMDKKSSRSGTLAQKFVLDATCHIQSNAFMLIPIGNDSECDFIDANKDFGKNLKRSDGNLANLILVGNIIFALLFSLGGYYLLFRAWKKERDVDKKNFLGLIIFYAASMFVLLVPLADEISFRFFLVLEFMPFLLLGFWFKFLSGRFSRAGASLVVIIAAFIVAANISYLTHYFSYLGGHAPEGQNGFEEITLGEVEYMADFITTHNAGAKNIYLDGKASELFKITKSVQYFTDEEGLDLNNLKKKQVLESKDKVFSIDVVKDPKGENQAPAGAVASGSFGRVRIYEMSE